MSRHVGHRSAAAPTGRVALGRDRGADFGILGLGALLADRHLQATLSGQAPGATPAAATRPADLLAPRAASQAEQAAKGAAAETQLPDRAAAAARPVGGLASADTQVVTAAPDRATPSEPPVGNSASAGAQVVAASSDRATSPPLPAGDTAPTNTSIKTPSIDRTGPAGSPAGGPASTDAPVQRPSFDIVRVGPSGSAVIAGRSAPDTDVALLDNGREIGRAKADESGEFVVIPDEPLPAGGQELALQAEPPGTAPVKGDEPALLIVPARPKEHAPTDASPQKASGDKPSGAVAVLAPTDAAPRLADGSRSTGRSAGPGGAAGRDYDAHGTIRFAGTARPGTSVQLYIDNAPVGEASADSQGRWNLVPAGPVNTGKHQLRADDLGPRGQVLSRAELPFQRATFGPDDLRSGQVVVQPRQSLWRIARHVYGHGMRYTVIYDANRDQIRDPNRIYPGQIFTLPSAASAAVLPGRAAGGSD